MSALSIPKRRMTLFAGAAAIVSVGFGFTSGDPWQIIHLRGAAIWITLALGIIAFGAGLLRNRLIALLAGGGFLVAALAVLADLAIGAGWAPWNGSTMSWWGGLALALIGSALAPEED